MDMRFHRLKSFLAFFLLRSRVGFSKLLEVGEVGESCCRVLRGRFVVMAPAPVSPRGSPPKEELFRLRRGVFCALVRRGVGGDADETGGNCCAEAMAREQAVLFVVCVAEGVTENKGRKRREEQRKILT